MRYWIVLLILFWSVVALAGKPGINRFDVVGDAKAKGEYYLEVVEKKLSEKTPLVPYKKVEAIADKGKLKQANCLTKQCLAVYQKGGVDWLVQVKINASDEIYDSRFQVINSETGKRSEVRTDECELCTVEEAMESLAAQIVALMNAETSTKPVTQVPEEAPKEEGGEMVIDSTPQGAIVFLSGKRLGQTPLRVNVQPGSYKIELQKSGYQTVAKNLNQPKGISQGTYAMHFSLAINPPLQGATSMPAAVPASSGGEPQYENLKWGLLGASLVATFLGAYLIGMDGTPGPNCSKDTNRCEEVYDTMVPGAALVVTGVAMAGTAYLFQKRIIGTSAGRQVGLTIFEF